MANVRWTSPGLARTISSRSARISLCASKKTAQRRTM
jgi:hypothetical protein